jgi:glycosyltransferase involved in cell wall biosynthesis
VESLSKASKGSVRVGRRSCGPVLCLAVALPSISIVTACLNAADTIEGALRSVRDQGYPDLEHVVVDGGSTDGTLEVLQREGVRFLSEPDEGRADAVNKGVAMTSGEVLAFLNADDRYERGALHAVGKALAARPDAAWATGYCRIVDGDGREIRRAVTAYKNLLLRHFSFDLYVTQNFVSDPATFVRRRALEEAGPLDPSYRISHDYDLWIRIARHHQPLVLRRELAAFRMAEGTLSIEGFERQFQEHAEVARRRAGDRRLPVAANALMSRLIVATYRAMRGTRRLRAG